MKKRIGAGLTAMMILLAGCSGNSARQAGSSDDSQQVTLEFMSNLGQHSLTELQKIAAGFERENPGIAVDISSQGADFEALMKAKMASGDLPDLWTTHGWSVERYGDLLTPLNDRPWFGGIKETFKPIIADDKGQVYVLPMTIAQDGMMTNKTVLEKSGVDIDKIETWTDFLDACEKIKSSGFTPIGMWGKDPRSFASFLNNLSMPLYITSPSHDDSRALEEGTFDWQKWTLIAGMLTELKAKGYLNEDVLTATEESVDQAIAKNEVAFKFRGGIKSILEFNPEADLGIAPLPAYYSDDRPFFVGGEGTAIGVWKDSAHREQAIRFVDYLAKPDNVKRLAEVEVNVAGFTDVNSDMGMLTDDLNKYAKVPINGYFDRSYLPGGMWSIMQQVGSGLVSGQMTPDDAVQTMRSNAVRLRSQND
ncbi:ABC transporter substrate-binding protein [Saccharibacillus brassicae]|nr:ABC transporter substrate-binding protein [Saccharibacillus brassicae]